MHRQKIIDFREMYLPKGNMAVYGDWASAITLDIAQLDWEEIGRIKASELETPLPKLFKLEEELEKHKVPDNTPMVGNPESPTREERERHEFTHANHKDWCEHCQQALVKNFLMLI